MTPVAAMAVRARPRARKIYLSFIDLLSAFVVLGWLAIAFIYREEFYDNYAIVASAVMLAGALAFYRWAPSAGREGYRLLGFFVCVQAFITSGVSVLNRVDVNPLLSTPTEEAFSASVESTAIFAGMFLVGALVTAPRVGRSLANPPSPTAGPTRLVGVILAGLTAVIALGLLASRDATGPFGTLPVILVNLGMIAPMLAAQPWITGKNTRLAVGIMLLGQAISVFYSSMLGLLILPMRDMLLARVYLRKRLPLAFIATMVGIAILLNPIKHIFRESVAHEGEPQSFEGTFSTWNEAATTTWSSDSRNTNARQGRFESSSARLDYNWISAHVFRMVPRRLPFEDGGTYAPIATILIPRLLYPNKPNSQEYARGRWMVKLGIQDDESIKTTAFALPAPAEAYWNFGWPGVFLVPVLLGGLVGLMLRWGPKDPVLRVGYIVLCATRLGQFLDMLVWIAPAFLAVGTTTVATVFISKLGRSKQRSAPGAHLPAEIAPSRVVERQTT